MLLGHGSRRVNHFLRRMVNVVVVVVAAELVVAPLIEEVAIGVLERPIRVNVETLGVIDATVVVRGNRSCVLRSLSCSLRFFALRCSTGGRCVLSLGFSAVIRVTAAARRSIVPRIGTSSLLGGLIGVRLLH